MANCLGRSITIGNRIDDFFTTIDAITTCEDALASSCTIFIDNTPFYFLILREEARSPCFPLPIAKRTRSAEFQTQILRSLLFSSIRRQVRPETVPFSAINYGLCSPRCFYVFWLRSTHEYSQTFFSSSSRYTMVTDGI